MIKFVHFVDRNVISQIKDQKLSEENESLLRSLDRNDSRISSLIASFEGQVGVLQTADQLKESIAKDTAALSGFFEQAYTDDMAKIAHGDHLHAIVDRQQERWDAYAEFVGFAQRRLYQPIRRDKLKAVQQELIAEASRLGVPIESIYFICALACLYRQEDAHEILKPSLKKGGTPNQVHNAMQDLASIGLYHTVSMMLGLESRGIQTSYITFDQWVRRFMSLTNARPGGMLLTTEMVSRTDFDISHELFPEASEEEFAAICDLLRTPAPVSYAPPGYISRFRAKLNFPPHNR